MSFIDTLSAETISTLMKSGGMMWIVFKPAGDILDASTEFCKWIGYQHSQLIGMTIANIARGENTVSQAMAKQEYFSPFSPWYSIRKQFVPNNERPQWGELCTTRHPASGDEIEFCWGWWTPAKSDAETALDMAKKDADMRFLIINKMSENVEKLVSVSDEEKFLLSGIHIIQKHPKASIILTTIVLTLFGVNNVMEVLQRFGLVDVPVQLQIKDESGALHDPTPEQEEYLRHEYVHLISE